MLHDNWIKTGCTSFLCHWRGLENGAHDMGGSDTIWMDSFESGGGVLSSVPFSFPLFISALAWRAGVGFCFLRNDMALHCTALHYSNGMKCGRKGRKKERRE